MEWLMRIAAFGVTWLALGMIVGWVTNSRSIRRTINEED
jgi:hypothetical protein